MAGKCTRNGCLSGNVTANVLMAGNYTGYNSVYMNYAGNACRNDCMYESGGNGLGMRGVS